MGGMVQMVGMDSMAWYGIEIFTAGNDMLAFLPHLDFLLLLTRSSVFGSEHALLIHNHHTQIVGRIFFD